MFYQPETYYLKPNVWAPNNEMPVLVYRDALPLPLSEENATEFFRRHTWISGGIFGHIKLRHCHPNTHECYGIIRGESTLLLGCGGNDLHNTGLELTVHIGDVVVLPAGTAHCNLESTRDYKYIGVYPQNAPKWRNELGKEGTDIAALRTEVEAVPMPSQDPVYGENGPLMELWQPVHPSG